LDVPGNTSAFSLACVIGPGLGEIQAMQSCHACPQLHTGKINLAGGLISAKMGKPAGNNNLELKDEKKNAYHHVSRSERSMVCTSVDTRS